VVTTGAISHAKLQSNHHHQQTNTQFLQAGCPSCRPTNSVKALKGKILHSMDLLTPNTPGGLPTLSLTTNSTWLPRGRFVMPLVSRLMPVPHYIVCVSVLLMFHGRYCCSIAILKYLSDKYQVADHWYPKDLQHRARVDCFMSWYHLTLRAGGAMVFTILVGHAVQL